MVATASGSCIGSLCQQTKQQSSKAASHGYGVRAAVVSLRSPSLHSSFSVQQTTLGLKSSSESNRRKQGGVDFRSEQLRLVPSAVASTDAAVDTSSISTTSVLGLEVVETLQPNSRVRLSIKVPAKVCKDVYNNVIKELSKKAKVPGFRPGKKIPESVLVNYIGLQQVRASAVEAILKKSLPEALSSVAGRALKESEHIVSKFQDLEASFSSDAPLSYVVAVDVAPEVKWKSENACKNLKVTVELDPTPPQEVADAEFKSRVKGLGSLKIAPDRGLEMGDVAIIDISANRLNEDGIEGEKVLSAEQKGFQLDTDDCANFIPGFVGALFNIRREETRSFDLVFPQTWHQTALRGINARFTAYRKEIFVRQLPELNDTIAPKLMEGLTTLDQVKEVLLEKHRINIEQAKVQQTQLAVTAELAKVVEIEVPNSLLEERGRQMYGAELLEMQTAIKLTKEQVVQFSSEEMVKNFLTSQKERIKNAVKQTLAVAEIYKLEKLGYSEEELKTEVQMALEEFKRYNQEYDEAKITEQWSRISSTGGLNNTSSVFKSVGVIRRNRALFNAGQRVGLWRAELHSESEFKDSLLPPSISSTPPGRLNAALGDTPQIVSEDENNSLVGEDAAVFNVVDQKTASWVYFTLVLGVVLAILYAVWLDPNTGYGRAFIDALTSFNSSHEVVMVELLFIFALVHSGGAGFRATGEKLIGERAYRVLFAGISLPLAVSAVVYFINHRYDGCQLWQFRTIPGVHEFCWALSFVSFLFLYPSTFNLLEVAAVDKPKVHMWETGIMRITRHPQVLWCIAHTLWIGNSFTLITSLGLTAHHLFGVWHGDRRLSAKYGEAFEVVKTRTSVIPFVAILEGRQELPQDYYKEFLRLPYYVLLGLTIGAYVSHPLLQSASHWLNW